MFKSISYVIKENCSNFYRIFCIAKYELLSDMRDSKFGIFWNFASPAIQVFTYWLVFGIAWGRKAQTYKGITVEYSMHCRWMFCRIFKDKRHHKNEVSGVGFTSNGLFKRTIQSLCDVNYHIRYFDFKRMVSKSKLALDSILYVLRIYAWRSYFTCIICTHNVMA